MQSFTFNIRTLFLGIILVASIEAAVLDNIKPGEWYEAPNSKLLPLAPVPIPAGSNSGFVAMTQCWSGAGYDSKRDRLIVWGGGHHDYSGNEMYGFDVNKLSWGKLSNSSTDFSGDEKTGEYPDGLPRARHTYDYIQYVPKLDAFCTFGGQGMFPSGQMGTSVSHCFDFSANKWVRKNTGAPGSIGGISAVDEATGKVWMHSAGGSPRLMEWNYTSDVWIPHANYDKGWLEYYYTAAAGAGKFVAIGINAAGKGQMIAWNLANPESQPTITELPAKVVITNSPGFVFDTKRNLFVAWAGGTKVFVLNPATMSWDQVQLSPANTVTPTDAVKNGTFGRFRYIASKDLFIGVNNITDNVYFFRMPTVVQVGIKKQHGMIHYFEKPNLFDTRGRELTVPSTFNYSLSQNKSHFLDATGIGAEVYRYSIISP